MRFLFCALLLLASPSAFCQAAPPASDEAPKRASCDAKLAIEGQVDTGYRIGRTTERTWLNVVEVRGLARLHVITSDETSHAFGIRGSFEQWFGVSPAPRRYLFGTQWEHGLRSGWSGGYWYHASESASVFAGSPSKSHGTFLAGGIAIGLDYSRAESLSINGKPRDGVRVSMGLHMGVAILSLEPGGALTANFDPDRPLDAEGWFKLGILRPASPFSGHVGYYYHVTGRFETHFFTVGFRAVF